MDQNRIRDTMINCVDNIHRPLGQASMASQNDLFIPLRVSVAPCELTDLPSVMRLPTFYSRIFFWKPIG